jgi:hypothetical protein
METINAADLTSVYRGAVAEQYVGQELLASGGSENSKLYYWSRMKKGSTAVEVLKSGSGMKTQFIVKENGKEVMKLGFPEGNIKGKINEYLSEKHEIDFSRAPKPGIYTLSDGSKVTGVFFWGMK